MINNINMKRDIYNLSTFYTFLKNLHIIPENHRTSRKA